MPQHTTKPGRILTEAELDAMAEEVESTDYNIGRLTARRRDRPQAIHSLP